MLSPCIYFIFKSSKPNPFLSSSVHYSFVNYW